MVVGAGPVGLDGTGPVGLDEGGGVDGAEGAEGGCVTLQRSLKFLVQ